LNLVFLVSSSFHTVVLLVGKIQLAKTMSEISELRFWETMQPILM